MIGIRGVAHTEEETERDDAEGRSLLVNEMQIEPLGRIERMIAPWGAFS